MGKQEGTRSGKLRMSSSQDPQDSRALCTGTLTADRSLDTGVAGSQPDACDRAECAGAPGDRPARGTKSATDRLGARVVEPVTGPRPPALQARGPRLDPALALARLADAAAGPGRTGAGARGSRGSDASGAGQRAVRTLEVFTLGVVWHGRVLPVGWAVLPYPWPKGRFTPTVCALIRQVAAVWPAGRPVHRVADRGFPSRLFLLMLRQVRWGWTVRLRATGGVA